MIFFLISLVVLVLVRWLPSHILKGGRSDAGGHYMIIREIRENRHVPPKRLKRMHFDNHLSYPWFFHWMLSWIPDVWLKRFSYVPSIICDVVQLVVVFVITDKLIEHVGVYQGHVFVFLIAGLLFALSPALLAFGIGPRAYELTARPFGEMLYSLWMLFLMLGFESSPWVYFPLAALCMAILMLSSKFALQAALFSLPVVVWLTGEWNVVWVVIGGFVIALLLSGGRYIDIIHGQIDFLIFYYKRLQREHPSLQNRNRWGKTWTQLRMILSGHSRNKGIFKSTFRLLEENTLFMLFSRNLLYVILFCYIALKHASLTLDQSKSIMWVFAWCCAPLLPFVVASCKPLRFLGEAERYPEYGVVPLCAMSAFLLCMSSSIWWVIILYGIYNVSYLIYTWLNMRVYTARADVEMLDALVGYLQTLTPESRILTIPVNPVTWPIAHRLQHIFMASADMIHWVKRHSSIFANYPFPVSDMSYWIDKQHVKYVVVHKQAMASSLAGSNKYDLSKCKLMYGNDAYEVYSCE